MTLLGKVKKFILKSIGLSDQSIQDVSNIRRGFDFFFKNKSTPSEAHLSLIRLFCSTRGYSNDFIHFLISKKYPKIKFKSHEGMLGTKTISDIKKIASEIKEKGYYVFPNGISRKNIEYLYDYGINQESTVRSIDESDNSPLTQKAKIDFKNPIGIRYDFLEDSLINETVVQEILTDSSILSLAQEYLGCLPRADGTSMWWNTDYSQSPNAEAATMWHFDMDRVKWLKIFFYLTDVTLETGPHCFVEKSHKSKGIPADLLKRGYARIKDEEIGQYFNKEKIIEFIAEKGTVIVEDTRGLHKGKPIVKGSRLIFQIQFSDHLFGATLQGAKFKKFIDPKTESFIREHKDIYARYISY